MGNCNKVGSDIVKSEFVKSSNTSYRTDIALCVVKWNEQKCFSERTDDKIPNTSKPSIQSVFRESENWKISISNFSLYKMHENSSSHTFPIVTHLGSLTTTLSMDADYWIVQNNAVPHFDRRRLEWRLFELFINSSLRMKNLNLAFASECSSH